jgi:hypothetical protein
MQVPASIYGEYPEVQRRMRRVVTRMKRGASFEEALGADQLIDTAEHEGDIHLLPADHQFAGQQGFHPEYALGEILGGVANGILPPETEETVFNTCLGTAWGVLLLLPHSLSFWVKAEHRWVPFLRAAARFWPVLAAEGARYRTGKFYLETVDHATTTVDYVLGNAGIFIRGINDPLPPNWPALVEAYAERRKHELH